MGAFCKARIRVGPEETELTYGIPPTCAMDYEISGYGVFDKFILQSEELFGRES
jgi:hypothetical protein